MFFRSIAIHDRRVSDVKPWPVDIKTIAAIATTVVLSSAVVFLSARRLSGALERPLPSGALLGVAMGFALVLFILRRTLFISQNTFSARQKRIGTIFFSFLAILFAGNLSLPGGNIAAIVSVWLILLVGEILAWREAFFLRYSPTVTPSTTESPFPVENAPSAAVVAVEVAIPASGIEVEEEAFRSNDEQIPPGKVIQQLTRIVSDEGAEEMQGWLRLPVEPGQRTGSLHIAFCPPFRSTPELNVEQIEGPESRIKIAQLYSYGVRLDIKLTAIADQSDSVLVHIFARAASTSSSST